MAIQQFQSVAYSTIWDVILNTYGTVDQAVKLMQDNDWPNVNTYPNLGDTFEYDDTLVENQNQLQTNAAIENFATRDRQDTNESNMVNYEQVWEADYVSNADGTTIINLPDLIGFRLIQVVKEIKNVGDINWGWNSTSAILTLLNGVTVDNGQTLYLLYALQITS